MKKIFMAIAALLILGISASAQDGKSIYKKYSDIYFRDGYGDGYSIMGEMLNQACANKYLETIFDEEGMEQVNRESLVGSRKYVYTPQIADFLDNYINDRKRYKTLKDFEPELENFLETVEEE